MNLLGRTFEELRRIAKALLPIRRCLPRSSQDETSWLKPQVRGVLSSLAALLDNLNNLPGCGIDYRNSLSH